VKTKTSPFIIALIVLIIFTSSTIHAQVITNLVTVSATYIFQNDTVTKGAVTTTPPPLKGLFTTKNLIAQMAESYTGIHPDGAVLQAVVSDTTNDPIVFQVKNKNGTIINVSDVVQFTGGANQVSSDTYNSKTRKSSGTSYYVTTLSYDDTALNTTNGLQFSYSGLIKASYTSIPTKGVGLYVENQATVQVGAVGEGNAGVSSTDTNLATPVVITSAGFATVGSGTVSY